MNAGQIVLGLEAFYVDFLPKTLLRKNVHTRQNFVHRKPCFFFPSIPSPNLGRKEEKNDFFGGRFFNLKLIEKKKTHHSLHVDF